MSNLLMDDHKEEKKVFVLEQKYKSMQLLDYLERGCTESNEFNNNKQGEM